MRSATLSRRDSRKMTDSSIHFGSYLRVWNAQGIPDSQEPRSCIRLFPCANRSATPHSLRKRHCTQVRVSQQAAGRPPSPLNTDEPKSPKRLDSFERLSYGVSLRALPDSIRNSDSTGMTTDLQEGNSAVCTDCRVATEGSGLPPSWFFRGKAIASYPDCT